MAPTRPISQPRLDRPDLAPTVREVAPTEALPRPAVPTRPPAPSSGHGGRWAVAAALLLALGGAGAWWKVHAKPAVTPTISLPSSEAVPAPAPAAGAPATTLPVEAKAEPKPTHAPKAAAKPTPKVEPPLTAEEAEAWLNDAAFGLVNTPAQSLKLIDRVVHDQPDLPRGRALQVAGLYYAGRYADMPGAIRSAEEAGLKLRQFAFYGAFQTMVRTERVEKRIPEDVREQLAELFPKAEGRGGRFARPFSRGN
jgi:hypothetical protein